MSTAIQNAAIDSRLPEKTKPMVSAAEIVRSDLEYICNCLREELPYLSGNRLLITGGAGFLGYYLVQAALHWNAGVDPDKAIRVTVYDNYIRGVPTWLAKLKGNRDVTLVRHDMSQALPRDMHDYEYIIHAASIASPSYYRKYPIETMDSNVNGVRALLEHCRKQSGVNKPVGGLLFLSSSEVYGDPSGENIPTPEEYRGNVSCTGPRACYDEAKRYGETLCVNFARHVGIPVKIARPFNNYGPGLKITDGRVIPDFARDIMAGEDIVMLSDGSPRRTFCYVADAIVGYYKILIKGKSGEAYNVGVGEPEISIVEVAKKLVWLAQELFGYKGKIVRQVSQDAEYLVDNPNRRCPMISKAKEHVGYNPAISLEEGLRRSLIWYQDNSEGEEA